MLEIKNFSKIYPNGKVGAENVNITVEKGDIFAFIGHNGAGKTTTIKSIVGISNITSGDIIIDGISIKDKPIQCKKILAYIPDNPDVYASLTGIQYINLIADFFNVSKQDREVLTKKYSKLLVMDEPFVGLDPKASYIVKNLMKEFASSGGAIFFSTHVLEVAEKLCNKVAIISNGKIVKQGTMEDIKKDESLEQVFLEIDHEWFKNFIKKQL